LQLQKWITMKNLIVSFCLLFSLIFYTNCDLKKLVKQSGDDIALTLKSNARSISDSAVTGATDALARALDDSLGSMLTHRIDSIIKIALKEADKEADLLLQKVGDKSTKTVVGIRDSLFNEKMKTYLLDIRNSFLSKDLGDKLNGILKNALNGIPDDKLQILIRKVMLEIRPVELVGDIRNELLGKATRDSLKILIDTVMMRLDENYRKTLQKSVNKDIGGIGKIITDNLYKVLILLGSIIAFLIWFTWRQRKKHENEIKGLKTEQEMMMRSINAPNDIGSALESFIRKIVDEKMGGK
jgi:hypothetical protein